MRQRKFESENLCTCYAPYESIARNERGMTNNLKQLCKIMIHLCLKTKAIYKISTSSKSISPSRNNSRKMQEEYLLQDTFNELLYIISTVHSKFNTISENLYIYVCREDCKGGHVGMGIVVLCISQNSVCFVLNSTIFALKIRFIWKL